MQQWTIELISNRRKLYDDFDRLSELHEACWSLVCDFMPTIIAWSKGVKKSSEEYLERLDKLKKETGRESTMLGRDMGDDFIALHRLVTRLEEKAKNVFCNNEFY